MTAVIKSFKGRRDVSGAITGQPYDPRALNVKETHVQTHPCGKSGALPLYMKERYGLPMTEADREADAQEQAKRQRQYDSRRKTWDNRTDFGREPESTEERRARMERQQRERQADELEKKIEAAQEEPEGDEENS